jgi:hypothetical protein
MRRAGAGQAGVSSLRQDLSLPGRSATTKPTPDSFFSGPVNLISFGSEQYHWHPDDNGGKAVPDGPAVRATITAVADTEFILPKASVTVIRGTIAAKQK